MREGEEGGDRVLVLGRGPREGGLGDDVKAMAGTLRVVDRSFGGTPAPVIVYICNDEG